MCLWLGRLKTRKMWQNSDYYISVPLWDNYFTFPGKLFIFPSLSQTLMFSGLTSSILKGCGKLRGDCIWKSHCTLQATCWGQMYPYPVQVELQGNLWGSWSLSNLLLMTEVSDHTSGHSWLEYNFKLTCASDEVWKYFCFTFLPPSPFLCPFPLIVPPQSLLIILLSIIKIIKVFIVKCKYWS